MSETGLEIKEVEPRGKILFLDINPDQPAHIKLAQAMFDTGKETVEEFSNIAASIIEEKDKNSGLKISQREARASLFLPENIRDWIGLVISGSLFKAGLRKQENGKFFLSSWKKELIDFIKAAKENNIPVLGICFGEHIITEALGGKVIHKKQRELGIQRIWRTSGSYGDPIMADLPDEFWAPQNHFNKVTRLPEGAVLLAENEVGVQGFRLGNIWAFEFHPEKTVAQVNDYLTRNKDRIEEEGFEPAKLQEQSKNYSPEIKTILTNFLRVAFSGKQ